MKFNLIITQPQEKKKKICCTVANFHSCFMHISGKNLGSEASMFYELMTASSAKVLNQWFESEPLKATLNTDAVIGAMLSPYQAGSGYVYKAGLSVVV